MSFDKDCKEFIEVEETKGSDPTIKDLDYIILKEIVSLKSKGWANETAARRGITKAIEAWEG